MLKHPCPASIRSAASPRSPAPPCSPRSRSSPPPGSDPGRARGDAGHPRADHLGCARRRISCPERHVRRKLPASDVPVCESFLFALHFLHANPSSYMRSAAAGCARLRPPFAVARRDRSAAARAGRPERRAAPGTAVTRAGPGSDVFHPGQRRSPHVRRRAAEVRGHPRSAGAVGRRAGGGTALRRVRQRAEPVHAPAPRSARSR